MLAGEAQIVKRAEKGLGERPEKKKRGSRINSKAAEQNQIGNKKRVKNPQSIAQKKALARMEDSAEKKIRGEFSREKQKP